MTKAENPEEAADALARPAAEAVRQRAWLELSALLTGPLTPELMQPVLRVLRRRSELEPEVLSDLARTLVRRLDIGPDAAVGDLRLWHEAPEALRDARRAAWRLLAAGRRGDQSAALAAPEAWTALLDLQGFCVLPAQAQAVALVEAAQAYWRSARRDGAVGKLQRAVELGERAAEVAGELPHAAEALTVAGDAGLDLWRYAPELGDLERATQHARDAYAQTPEGHPRRGWRAARLAGKLINKSVHEGTIAPLDEALSLLQPAPDATADPEDRCGVLHDLARAAGRRWQIARENEDLDLSVTAARQAVREVPPESRDVRFMRSGLATALQRRGSETGSLEDLEEALRIRRELVAIEIEGPRQGLVRSNLARSLRELGVRSGRQELLGEAVQTMLHVVAETANGAEQRPTRLHDLARCYRSRDEGDDRLRAHEAFEQALAAAAGRPEVRAVVANDLGSILTEDGDDARAADAYEGALDALHELQHREDHLADRLIQLGRVENLPANATRATLLARGASAALAVADKGRGVVLSEVVGQPALAAAGQVAGDVLCMGAADAGGFVLLRIDGRYVAKECPQLTGQAVAERVRTLSTQLERRREDPAAASQAIHELSTWLGTALRLDELPLPERLGIVPLGPLGLAPVHLAAYRGRPLCLQRAVTLRLRPSRLRPVRRIRKGSRKGLAVDSASSGLEPLLLAEHELRAMGAAVARCTTLTGSDARRDATLTALQRADVAHFTGHARSMPNRPLDSCIFLAGDEVLTVGDLLSAPPSGRLDLVALTGCETATGGRRVPDESVSLAAGAVVAGAEVVLSTLWPISQLAAALICARFYEHWAASPGRPDVALAEAQRWMRDASVAELAEACERIGAPVLDAAQLSEPLHWAGWMVTVA